jgi:chromosome segregation ATPase
MKFNFKFPLVLRSKIQSTLQKEIKNAETRKDKEFEKIKTLMTRQHHIEKEQLIQKYTDMIEKDSERYKDTIESLTLEKNNEIKSLETENDSLYKWVTKFQDTYSEYQFKLNDLRKRLEKVFVFVNSLLKQTTSQFQEIVKLKDDIDHEIEEESKQKEAMHKALSFK